MALAQTVFAVLGLWLVSFPQPWAAVLPLDGLLLQGSGTVVRSGSCLLQAKLEAAAQYVVLQALGLEGEL